LEGDSGGTTTPLIQGTGASGAAAEGVERGPEDSPPASTAATLSWLAAAVAAARMNLAHHVVGHATRALRRAAEIVHHPLRAFCGPRDSSYSSNDASSKDNINI